MSTNNNSAGQDVLPPEDPLKAWQKFWAVILIVVPIIITICFLISYWPDKPPTKEHSDYRYSNITLIESATPPKGDIIPFSSLVLILVSFAGFLGNLVYVAASLTAFIGSGKFRRSWIPWYFVKPFTAAGLALFLYLALNDSTITTPVNLNGIIATAALAGLFADIATSKLKEMFTAIFKPVENLPDRLNDPAPVAPVLDVDSINPAKVNPTAATDFEIPGQRLDAKNLLVTINGKKQDELTVTPTLLKFTFTPAAGDATITKFSLLVTDAKGNKIAEKDL